MDFLGFYVTSLISLVINIMIGLDVAQSLLGLNGIALLYGVLQMGDTNKGWTQLD